MTDEMQRKIICSTRMRKSNLTAAMAGVDYIEKLGHWFLSQVGPDGVLKQATFVFLMIADLGKAEKLISVFMRSIARQDADFCDVFYVNLRDGLEVYFEEPTYSGHFSDFDGFLFVLIDDVLPVDMRSEFLKILENRIRHRRSTIVVSNAEKFKQFVAYDAERVARINKTFVEVQA